LFGRYTYIQVRIRRPFRASSRNGKEVYTGVGGGDGSDGGGGVGGGGGAGRAGLVNRSRNARR